MFNIIMADSSQIYDYIYYALLIVGLTCSYWLFKLSALTLIPYEPKNKPIDIETCQKRWSLALEKCPKTDKNYLVFG
jgi:hypothetical protein